jgi:hypothetical protein
MQIILYSVASWMVFLFTDFLFFLFFIGKDAKTLSITFIPDTFTVLFTSACYLGIGLCLGLCIKGLEVPGRNFLPLKHNQWLHLTAVLSVAFNSLMNAVLLYKNHIVAIPLSLSAYVMAVILVLLIIPGLWLVFKIAGLIKKAPVFSLPSLCVSGEVFWNIIREGLYSGGYLKDSFMQGSVTAVILTALAVSSLVFTFFYYYASRFFFKSKPKLRMRCLLITLPGALLFSSMTFGSTCHAAQSAG